MNKNSKSSKATPQSYYHQVEDRSFLKINEILNSIYAMEPEVIQMELFSSAKIVGGLLHN